MTNFIEKARAGRMNALATLAVTPVGHAQTARNRAPSRHNVVTFASSRARRMDTILT